MRVFSVAGKRFRLLIGLTVGYLLISGATAKAFDCASRHCDLQQDGSYPHLVIGTIQGISSRSESRKIFRHARGMGYWQDLPASPERFASTIRAVSIQTRTPGGVMPVTMLMGEDEFRGAPLKVGDMVRYTPHDKAHERSPDNSPEGRAYWQLIGCVMVVCAAGDTSCRKRYQAGVYELTTGMPLAPASGKVWSGISPVDPISLLPKPGLTQH
ncbi:MAG: hypothetical protein VW625_01990 [Perlucidibaca sp.]